MGFRQADKNGNGGYARVWSVEDNGNYSTAQISTSRRSRNGEGYETDFNGFVRFIGSAHTKAKNLNIETRVNSRGNTVSAGTPIQILSCEVTTSYNAATKTGYTQYAVFDFETQETRGGSNGANKAPSNRANSGTRRPAKNTDPDDDEEVPF